MITHGEGGKEKSARVLKKSNPLPRRYRHESDALKSNGKRSAPRIRDYFLIGNLHTAALVSKYGSIDWLCLPHFDTKSIFASILDTKKGGSLSVVAVGFSTKAKYVDETAIVETTFSKGKQTFRVRDFMLPIPRKHSQAHYLVRKVAAGKRATTVRFLFDPKPHYATDEVRVAQHARSLSMQIRQGKRPDTVRLHLPEGAKAKQTRKGWLVDIPLKAGETKDLVLEHTKQPRSHYRGQDFEPATIAFWKKWVAEGTFFDFCREDLVRSAITLKLMQFYPTGAIVAAPTTSLPEVIGGVRNWDYRYSWVRDSVFTLYALYVLGYKKEANRFFTFMESVSKESRFGGVDLHLFYTVWGERVPREQFLEHLSGYRNSAPVRLGNDATDQFQLDIYGSMIDARYFMSTRGLSVSTAKARQSIMSIVENIEMQWMDRDSSMWEVRGSGPQHYTYSKVMAWVGVNRALRMAKQMKLSSTRIQRWQRLEKKIRDWIMLHCFDAKRQTFVQHPETDRQDATNFLILMLQFFDRDDPRVNAVIDSTCRELRDKEVFVYRYKNEDGLPGKEGAFVLCSYWFISALAYAGRVDEAKKLFYRLEQYISQNGLISEEVNPETGEYLGNFPQAFSHVGYIMSAYYIHKYGNKSKRQK